MDDILEQAVRNLLDALSADAVDEAIVEYITGLIREDDGQSSLEDVQEILCSVSEPFCRLNGSTQAQLLEQLFKEKEQALDESAAADQNRHFLIRAGNLKKEQHTKVVSAPVELDCRVCNDKIDDTFEQVGTEELDKKLDVLLELCPIGITRDFLREKLERTFAGNMEGTVEWLLGCENLLREQSAWQLLRQKRAKQELQEQEALNRSRKQILARFDLQAMPEVNPSKKQQGIKLQDVGNPTTKKVQVRYREGQVVSTKGDKYVVEKLGEEWDGGSRGKVYTKGKRGKGFI